VTYDGAKRVFTPVQLLGAYFTKMRETIAVKNPGATTADIVVSVPAYYTDAQRAAVKDAAGIAGLDCLRVMNEGTAAALSYGIYKSARKEFPEGVETKVMFLDMGHAHFTCTIAGFTNTSLRILASESDSSIGGREFDRAIAKHFADEFKIATRQDAWTDRKARIKLLVAAEKAKTTITPFGVNSAKASVECLLNDRDFSSVLTIEKMDELVADQMERMQAAIRRAMAAAGVASYADLMAVELVGGAIRPRVVKRRAAEVLGLPLNEETGHGLSTSMNLDECIARGCALACAMLSPIFRVKPFDMVDTVPFPIRVSWDPAPTEPASGGGGGGGGGGAEPMDEDDKDEGAAGGGAAGGGGGAGGAANSIVLFKAGDGAPLTRRITFRRNVAFDLTVEYDAEAPLPAGANRVLRRYHVEIPPEALEGADQAPKLRIDFRHDLNGITNIVKAEVLKEVKEAAAAPPAPADGDAAMSGTPEAAAPAPEAKKKYKRVEAKVTTTYTSGGLTPDALTAAIAQEVAMKAKDDDIHATHDMRNSLEAYIYATRDAVYGDLADYGTGEEKDALTAALTEAEEWLYDNMEADRGTFAGKLAALRKLGGPLQARKTEAEGRNAAVNALLAAVDEYRSVIYNASGRHGHLTETDRDTLRAACSEAESWLRGVQDAQGGLAMHQDPVLKVAEVNAKRDALVRELRPIANKPVPAPAPVAPPPAPAAAPEPAPAEPNPFEAAPASTATPAGEGGGSAPMDVDASAAAAAGAPASTA
jgi:heat shock 70kDa protein 4